MHSVSETETMSSAAHVSAWSAQRRRRAVLALVLLFALTWFGNLGVRKLVHPDEGRYAEIPREMVATGDWVTPRLNDLKYFEKPPLQYWATAAAYELFGFNEWSARIWPALTGFLGIFMTFWIGRRLFSERAAIYAALVLVASPYYVFFGHVLTLDMAIAFFLSASVFFLLLSKDERLAERIRGRWMLAAWAAMGFAFLTKGLIAFALPLLTCIVYSTIKGDLHVFRGLRVGAGLAILAAICLPWIVIVAARNPEFLTFFFIHEHFNRFTSSAHHRVGPFWYFVPIVLCALLPFIPAFYMGCRHAVVHMWDERARIDSLFFLGVWCLVVFGFFSASQSKLPAYVLPLMPAAALLAGEALAQETRASVQRWIVPLGLAIAALFFGVSELIETLQEETAEAQLYEHFSNWTEGGALVVLVGVWVASILLRKQHVIIAVACVSASLFICTQLIVTGLEALSPLKSAHAIAEYIKSVDSSLPVYSVRMYDQTLPPYLGKPVRLVEVEGEMSLGIRAEPHKTLPTVHAFTIEWKDVPHAWALMPHATYSELHAAGFEGAKVLRDTRRVLVRK